MFSQVYAYLYIFVCICIAVFCLFLYNCIFEPSQFIKIFKGWVLENALITIQTQREHIWYILSLNVSLWLRKRKYTPTDERNFIVEFCFI